MTNGNDWVEHIENCFDCEAIEDALNQGTITKEQAYKLIEECFDSNHGE